MLKNAETPALFLPLLSRRRLFGLLKARVKLWWKQQKKGNSQKTKKNKQNKQQLRKKKTLDFLQQIISICSRFQSHGN